MNIYGLSDIGLVRKDNQDNIYYDQNKNEEYFALVCDGIGGGNAGDVASKIASNSLADSFLNKKATKTDAVSKKWIEEAIRIANDEIFSQSSKSKNFKGMGTTIAGVFYNGKSTYIFHCGDSRVYGLYKELICLTEDHNLTTDLIHSGELPEKEAISHPKGNVLTNALGIWNHVQPEIHKIKAGYKELLVCSDGLHGFVKDAYIQGVLQSDTGVKEQVDKLLHASLEAGGYDNVSVIVLREEEK